MFVAAQICDNTAYIRNYIGDQEKACTTVTSKTRETPRRVPFQSRKICQGHRAILKIIQYVKFIIVWHVAQSFTIYEIFEVQMRLILTSTNRIDIGQI